MPVISQHFLSRSRLLNLRKKAEQLRKSQSRPHVLHVFLQPDEPYSQLLAQALPKLQSRYAVSVLRHGVSEPDDSAAPEREKLKAYSQIDAKRLADHYGLVFPAPFGKLSNSEKSLQEAHALRKKWGHYLSGVIYYEGEWYWGIDRLHHLESRLNDLGLSTQAQSLGLHKAKPLFFTPQYQPVAHVPEGTDIDFYFSFRSPYSAISAAQVFKWAKENGVQVNLKYVLPMVMRGLPVPAEKSRYISLDAAREAYVQNVKFGCLNDPVGRPTERGLSLIPFAQCTNLQKLMSCHLCKVCGLRAWMLAPINT